MLFPLERESSSMTTTRLQALAVSSSTVRRSLAAPPLPREHGVWAWLLLPLVAGGAASGSASAPLLLLGVAAVAGFVVRAPLELALRRPAQRRSYLTWSGLYAMVVLLTLAPLLFQYHRWGLLPLGTMGVAIALPVLMSRRLRYRWRAQGELLAVAGLSLLAPAAYYAATGDFDRQAAALWLPPALYGAGSILYVRMLFDRRRRAGPRGLSGARGAVALYLAALWVTVAAGVVAGLLPPLMPVAFLPATLKISLALARRTPVDNVRRTGVVEVLHAALFAGLLVVAYAIA
jgi:hypothetical protein